MSRPDLQPSGRRTRALTETAVITQPTYIPWIGYFEQLARADVFVFLDNVQFESRSWHTRNRLMTSDGHLFWLTVPVAAHPRETLIKDVRISPDRPAWREEHLRSIRTHLGKAPYFRSTFEMICQWLMKDYEYLADLTIAGIALLADILDLRPRFSRASELEVGGRRTRLLVGLCERVGAIHYYSAAGSREYMSEEEYLFSERGISVEYQEWAHPIYPQLSKDFVSHLSILDALMNIGPDGVRRLLIRS